VSFYPPLAEVIGYSTLMAVSNSMVISSLRSRHSIVIQLRNRNQQLEIGNWKFSIALSGVN